MRAVTDIDGEFVQGEKWPWSDKMKFRLDFASLSAAQITFG